MSNECHEEQESTLQCRPDSDVTQRPLLTYLLEGLEGGIPLLQCVKEAVLPLCCLNVCEHLHSNVGHLGHG
jgi:hypothetical protein